MRNASVAVAAKSGNPSGRNAGERVAAKNARPPIPTMTMAGAVAQGPVELDAGMFLATICRRVGFLDETLANEAARAEQAFLAGTAGLFEERALAWHRAAALLRLADKLLDRRPEQWQARAQALLGEATRLAEAAALSTTRPRRSDGMEPRLRPKLFRWTFPPEQRIGSWSMKASLFLVGGIAVWLMARGPVVAVATTTVRPEARAQTAPVPHKGDAADDPA